ncbi:MAG: aminoglycoside phosphotransferase family protein, partial [Anaerolineae bacterium]|nr:aminoglycoside phosphotransferase family protein [Anaerolineae bacterium]
MGDNKWNQEFVNGSQVKMHEGEIDIDIALIKRLLNEQFPNLAERSITAVRSTGTVNAIFRVGDEFCVRMPRLKEWAESIDNEWIWLPKLAPHISLNIPKPLARGTPTNYYPCPWAIYHWMDGSPYQDELIGDQHQAAYDLANFIKELQRIDGRGAPRGGRHPLIELDTVTRSAIAASRNVVDDHAVSAAWALSLKALSWDGKPVWIHGDLLKSNLLVKDGRLYAVIDFGGVGIGDPAADVVPAWSVFNKASRETFRQVLDVDDNIWSRARGYALHQALMIIPYYQKTNPDFVTMA